MLIPAKYIARASAGLSQITQARVVWLHGVRWIIAAAAGMCLGKPCSTGDQILPSRKSSNKRLVVSGASSMKKWPALIGRARKSEK